MRKMYDIIIAIILALGAIISVAIFSNAIDKINKKSDVIVVKGYAEVKKQIKEYSFIINIKSESKELDSLYENLYNKEDKIFEQISFPYEKKEAILTSNFKDDKDVVSSYNINKDYEIKAKTKEEIMAIREELAKRVVQVKGVSMTDINVSYANVDEDKLIKEAIKDAKNKAYAMVKENGKTLGNLREIYQDKVTDKGGSISVIITISYEIN